jgi:hypothetical protein
MALFDLFEAVILPAFTMGSRETLLGALAIMGSAVLAADGSWSGNVVRLPLKQQKQQSPQDSNVRALTTGQPAAMEPAKYDHADSQSLVLRRFCDLKDYVEAEPAFSVK